MYLLTALIFFTFAFIFERISINSERENSLYYMNYGRFKYIPEYDAYPYYLDYGEQTYSIGPDMSDSRDRYTLIWKRNRLKRTISVYIKANTLPKGLKKEEYSKLMRCKRYHEWILLETLPFKADPAIIPFIDREENFVKTLGNKLYGVVLYNYRLLPIDRLDSSNNYVITTGATKCYIQRALYDKSINRPYFLKVLDNLTKEEQWNLTIDKLASGDYGFYKIIKTGKAKQFKKSVSENEKGGEICEKLTFAEFMKWGGFDLSVYENPDEQSVIVSFCDDPESLKNEYTKEIFGEWLFDKYLVLNDDGNFVIDDKSLYNDLVEAGYEE